MIGQEITQEIENEKALVLALEWLREGKERSIKVDHFCGATRYYTARMLSVERRQGKEFRHYSIGEGRERIVSGADRLYVKMLITGELGKEGE